MARKKNTASSTEKPLETETSSDAMPDQAAPTAPAKKAPKGKDPNTITKNDMTALISKKKGVTEEIVGIVIDAFCEETMTALAESKVVNLPGFGKFFSKITKPRETPNPQKKGEKVQVPSKKKGKFNTFSAFDAILAKSYVAPDHEFNAAEPVVAEPVVAEPVDPEPSAVEVEAV